VNAFDTFETLQGPVGKVVLVVCDSKYYERFSKRLISSFHEHVRSFECLHFHVISPSAALLGQISKPSQLRVTYSFEDSSNLQKIADSLVRADLLFGALQRQVQGMLVAEQYRNRKALGLLASSLFKYNFPVRFLISQKWLNAIRSKVYYACRRFMLPERFFNSVDSTLLIDADSYFQADIKIDEAGSRFGAFAIERRNSWSRFLAGYVYVKNEKSGRLFQDKMRGDLTRAFLEGKIYWGVDQVCLDRCGEAGLLGPFHHPDVAFSDASHSALISLKGNAKWRA